MANIKERIYQQQLAAQRFENAKDEQKAMQKRLLSESVTAVEPQDRLKLRRSLINPNDGLAHERQVFL
ncbi:MAG: hypothetical protein GY805_05315 [Chloroflexi bacterium]|nr:hypothetical protein [Chloroflexota bacterium]